MPIIAVLVIVALWFVAGFAWTKVEDLPGPIGVILFIVLVGVSYLIWVGITGLE